jgi:hypothetical protein
VTAQGRMPTKLQDIDHNLLKTIRHMATLVRVKGMAMLSAVRNAMVLMLQTLASLLMVMTRDTGHIYLFEAPSSKRSLCEKFTYPLVPPKRVFRVLPREIHPNYTPRILAPPQPAQRTGKVSRKNALLAL